MGYTSYVTSRIGTEGVFINDARGKVKNFVYGSGLEPQSAIFRFDGYHEPFLIEGLLLIKLIFLNL